jgi:cell fate (sporulation/competence/biofilm development) regulator YlbF (YheA/YmcA/DUF963 family)
MYRSKPLIERSESLRSRSRELAITATESISAAKKTVARSKKAKNLITQFKAIQQSAAMLSVMPETKKATEQRMDKLAKEYGRTPRGNPRHAEIANELSALCLRLDRLAN